MSNTEQRSTVFFMANCMYRDHLAGGDIHFLHMAEAALAAGFRVHFFGGHALQKQLEARRLPATITLTDRKTLPPFSAESLGGQFRLLFDYAGRFFRTLPKLSQISRQDVVYAVTDYWFDAWPMIFSKAPKKLMILGMDAPTLREIILRTRPDVTRTRLASIYYWLSQNISLRVFRRCKTKRLFYVHPAMKGRLLALGYSESELTFISNGIDVRQADAIPEQKKIYDAIWAGRVHPQKGIEDLLATLAHLAKVIENFRAVVIGHVKNELAPKIEALGLSAHVTFSGFVSEAEKFRLLKASRVFLMPSHYESWGIVIGEALACGLPVVAYDLAPYREIFKDFVFYVPQGHLEDYKKAAEKLIGDVRDKGSSVPDLRLREFQMTNSWPTAQDKFQRVLQELARAST